MSFIDTLLATFAPHQCLGCAAEGQLLCAECRTQFGLIPERCYRCRKLSPDYRTCSSCRSSSQLFSVRPAVIYEGLAKDIVWRLKFHGTQAAAREIAALLFVPEKEILITHVPTATSRVRQRGYDQARLLARQLASIQNLPHAALLARSGQHHQVGASRRQRLMQLEQAFRVIRPETVKDAHIVLVDDVVTTGATLEAAARTLKAAGAYRVEAVVFAQP